MKNISSYNSFGAKQINLLPSRDLSQVNLSSETVSEILKKYHSEKIVVFGDNLKLDLSNRHIPTEIVQLYGTNKSTESPNVRYEIIDTWSFATANLYNKYFDQEAIFFFTSEFLSHLEDPRPFLLFVKQMLLRAQGYVFIIWHETNSGYWNWTQNEFCQFISNSGFKVEIAFDILFMLELSEASYKNFLLKNNICPDYFDSDFLLVTTEDAGILPTGGIGTYVKNIKSFNPHVPVLYCNLQFKPQNEDLNKAIFPSEFIENLEYSNFFDGIGLIEVVKCILYLLPNLRIIEFQDYNSVGFRLIQARELGVLPNYLKMRVFLHGNIDYVKYGTQDNSAMNYSKEELISSVKDHYIFENADEVYAPSKYLMNDLMTNEFKYNITNSQVRKLPFDLNLLPEHTDIALSRFDNLVFIGKYSQLKGFPDFIEAVKIIYESTSLRFKKIYTIAPGSPDRDSATFISGLAKYVPLHLKHHDLLSFISKEKSRSLFVIASRGESYSFVILEQLLLGSAFVSYGIGGIPEVIEYEKIKETFLSDANPTALAKKICQINGSDYNILNDIINTNCLQVRERQLKINASWQYPKCLMVEPTYRGYKYGNASKEISLIVPIYNTKREYLVDLMDSINRSIIIPTEVLFINDGSEPDYSSSLNNIIEQYLDKDITKRIIYQGNKGLAGARNTGLKQAITKYIYVLDSDDVLLPNTLLHAWVAINLSPSLIAVSGFANYFVQLSEARYDNKLVSRNVFWKPIGNEIAKAVSLFENNFMTANALVKREEVLSVGGWDETDKATWEDWAFYLKLAWSGYKFSLIPIIGYFYRNTPGSMSKTYNRYFGRRRIIRNLTTFSKLDANVIISLMNKPTGQPVPIERLIELEAELIKKDTEIEAYYNQVEELSKEIEARGVLISELSEIIATGQPVPIERLIELEAELIKKDTEIEAYYNQVEELSKEIEARGVLISELSEIIEKRGAARFLRFLKLRR